MPQGVQRERTAKDEVTVAERAGWLLKAPGLVGTRTEVPNPSGVAGRFRIRGGASALTGAPLIYTNQKNQLKGITCQLGHLYHGLVLTRPSKHTDS